MTKAAKPTNAKMLKSSSSSPSLYQSNASVLASISAVDKAVCEKAMSGSGGKSDPENDPLCMSFKGEKSSSAGSEGKKIDKVSSPQMNRIRA